MDKKKKKKKKKLVPEPIDTEQEVNYDAVLFIDKNQLDEEAANQSRLFAEFARRTHHLLLDVEGQKSAVDLAKTNVDVTKSKLLLAMKKRPEKYGLPEKATVDHVNAAIAVHPKCQRTVQALHEATEKYNRLRADHSWMLDFLKALDQRKFGISELIELHGRDYFSTPTTMPHGRMDIAEIIRNAERAFVSPKRDVKKKQRKE